MSDYVAFWAETLGGPHYSTQMLDQVGLTLRIHVAAPWRGGLSEEITARALAALRAAGLDVDERVFKTEYQSTRREPYVSSVGEVA